MDIRLYFETIPAWHRSLILAAGLFAFFFLEYFIPYVSLTYNKAKHAVENLLFTGTSAIVNFLLAFLVINACQEVTRSKFGLLYLIPLPTWAFVLTGLLLMDLIGAWLVHFLEHKVYWMWRFHTIHHLDVYVDVSTANRHHPVESIFRLIFTVLAVLISGSPVWLVFLYQTLSVLLSQFNHANINLSSSTDRLISLVFVSPNMHKVHHHNRQPYTDSNYANIFSVWDRLFGTFRSLSKNNIKYGLDEHVTDNHHSVLHLMRLPFKKKTV